MTRRNPLAKTALGLVAALALTTLGCTAHVHPRGAAVRVGPPVVIARGHVHTARCGHFKYRGKWYHAKGHVHAKKCGHKLRGGVWVLVR